MPPAEYIDPTWTYDNKIPSISEITPDLFIGNENSILLLDATQARESNRVGAVISMMHNSHNKWSQPWFRSIIPHHLWIECADTSTQDLLQYMTLCCDFIDARLESKNALLSGERQYQDGDPYDPQTRVHNLSTYRTQNMGIDVDNPPKIGVLVHCQVGKSRSTTITIAYLMRKHRRDIDEVLKEVREKRDRTDPNPNFLAQLRIWERVQYQIWDDEEKKIPKDAYQEYLDYLAVKRRKKGLTGDEHYRDVGSSY